MEPERLTKATYLPVVLTLVVTSQRAAIASRLRAGGHTLDQIALQLRVSRASVIRMLSAPRITARDAS